MRLCLMSDNPFGEAEAASRRDAISPLLSELTTLAQVGHDVSWLTSLVRGTLTEDLAVRLIPSDAVVPPTCRYVLPCQGYTLAGVRVIDIAAAIWQQAELHTRLFTFLRLFQDAVKCDVWHVWGTLPLVYLVLYTGCLMHIPVVVSVCTALGHDTASHPFLWEWVGRHVRYLAVVETLPSELSVPPQAFPPLSSRAVSWHIASPHYQALAAMYASVVQSS